MKMILFLLVVFAVIGNYSKTRVYLADDFGIAREHSALIVLAGLLLFGFFLLNVKTM